MHSNSDVNPSLAVSAGIYRVLIYMQPRLHVTCLFSHGRDAPSKSPTGAVRVGCRPVAQVRSQSINLLATFAGLPASVAALNGVLGTMSLPALSF